MGDLCHSTLVSDRTLNENNIADIFLLCQTRERTVMKLTILEKILSVSLSGYPLTQASLQAIGQQLFFGLITRTDIPGGGQKT